MPASSSRSSSRSSRLPDDVLRLHIRLLLLVVAMVIRLVAVVLVLVVVVIWVGIVVVVVVTLVALVVLVGLVLVALVLGAVVVVLTLRRPPGLLLLIHNLRDEHLLPHHLLRALLLRSLHDVRLNLAVGASLAAPKTWSFAHTAW